MNETMYWWLSLLERKNKEALNYASTKYRSKAKRDAFMEAWHWTMINTRADFCDKIYEKEEAK
jgi:hypothetical protein